LRKEQAEQFRTERERAKQEAERQAAMEQRVAEFVGQSGDPSLQTAYQLGGAPAALEMYQQQQKPVKMPMSYQEYQLAQQDPAYAEMLRRKQQADTTRIELDMRKFGDSLGKKAAESVVADYDKYNSLVTGFSTLDEAEKLLDKGVITGTGAKFITSVGGALQQLGFNKYADPVANTQAYAALMGNEVAKIIKEFGAGTGLSDADREYAEKIAGGNIELTEGALRELIRLNRKYRTQAIERYNKKAKKVMESEAGKSMPYSLVIDLPSNKPDETGEIEFLGFE